MLRRCCSAMAGTGRANASRKVVRNVESREQREGEGARVRRSIGAVVPQLDPFLMLDNFCVQLPAGKIAAFLPYYYYFFLFCLAHSLLKSLFPSACPLQAFPVSRPLPSFVVSPLLLSSPPCGDDCSG